MTIGAVVLLYIVAPITLTAWLICLVSHSQGYDDARFSDLDASAGELREKELGNIYDPVLGNVC